MFVIFFFLSFCFYPLFFCRPLNEVFTEEQAKLFVITNGIYMKSIQAIPIAIVVAVVIVDRWSGFNFTIYFKSCWIIDGIRLIAQDQLNNSSAHTHTQRERKRKMQCIALLLTRIQPGWKMCVCVYVLFHCNRSCCCCSSSYCFSYFSSSERWNEGGTVAVKLNKLRIIVHLCTLCGRLVGLSRYIFTLFTISVCISF